MASRCSPGLDARVTKLVPTTGGQALELTADLFNVANGRGIYSVQDTPRHEVDVPATRWHVQLSARYTF